MMTREWCGPPGVAHRARRAALAISFVSLVVGPPGVSVGGRRTRPKSNCGQADRREGPGRARGCKGRVTMMRRSSLLAPTDRAGDQTLRNNHDEEQPQEPSRHRRYPLSDVAVRMQQRQ